MLTEVLSQTIFSLSLAFLIAVSSVCTIQAQSTDSLVLNVTVTNPKGVVIRGLTMENFSVVADKQEQKILSLTDREVPASVGILIDDSGSQYISKSDPAHKIRTQFRDGLERFFQLTNPANEYFLVSFNSKVQLLQDWTSDPRAVVEKLDSLTFKKPTSMYDAIQLGVEKVKTGRNSKHVLILISDGVDTNSKIEFKEARDLLKASDVLLYCVWINFVPVGDTATSPYVEGPNILNEFSVNSGGRGLFMNEASGEKAFREMFELIALELRTQYQLVIAPEHFGGKAKWRRIKVNAIRVDAARPAEPLVPRTRQWYYR